MIAYTVAHVSLGEGELAVLVHATGGLVHTLALVTIGVVTPPSRAALRRPSLVAGLLAVPLLYVAAWLIEAPLDLGALSVAAAVVMGLGLIIDPGRRGHAVWLVGYLGTYALQQGQHVSQAPMSPVLSTTTAAVATALWLLAGATLAYAAGEAVHGRRVPRCLGGAVVLAAIVSLALRWTS